MGHGYKIPTIKPSKNPNRSISEIVQERGKAYWNSIDVMDLTPEQRKHFKKVMRKEVRSK